MFVAIWMERITSAQRDALKLVTGDNHSVEKPDGLNDHVVSTTLWKKVIHKFLVN